MRFCHRHGTGKFKVRVVARDLREEKNGTRAKAFGVHSDARRARHARSPSVMPEPGQCFTGVMDEALVLTVQQPWAWAIVHGGKDVENRTWSAEHRGVLLIHAGQTFERVAYDVVRRLATAPVPPARELVRGAIIGVVDLEDCQRDSDSAWARRGWWHWCLRNPRPLQPVFPCTGKRLLWEPPRGLSV